MRRLIRPVALLLVLLTLGGCWSRREINDLGLITTVGIDLSDEGLIQVTISIAQPAAGGGGKGKQTPAAERPKILMTKEGRSVTEALRLIELAAPRQLNLTHTEAILLGERLVERGIDTYVDYLLREPQIRLNAHLMILRGSPITALLEADPIMENLQSQALTEMEINQAGLTVTLREFFVARATDHQAPIVPVIELQPHRSQEREAPSLYPELVGAAIMKGNRVVAYLDRQQIRGAMWLKGRARGAVITLPCPGEEPAPELFISLRVLRAGHGVQPQWDGDSFAFTVRLNADVRITEMHCAVDLDSPAELAELRRRAELAVVERLSSMLAESQAAQADPFEFGDQVRVGFPGLWEQVGGKRWGKTWADAELQVQARFRVEHTGTAKNPAHLDLHKE